MKKLIIPTVVSAVCLSGTLSASASSVDNKFVPKTEKIAVLKHQETKPFVLNVDGVNVTIHGQTFSKEAYIKGSKERADLENKIRTRYLSNSNQPKSLAPLLSSSGDTPIFYTEAQPDANGSLAYENMTQIWGNSTKTFINGSVLTAVGIVAANMLAKLTGNKPNEKLVNAGSIVAGGIAAVTANQITSAMDGYVNTRIWRSWSTYYNMYTYELSFSVYNNSNKTGLRDIQIIQNLKLVNGQYVSISTGLPQIYF